MGIRPMIEFLDEDNDGLPDTDIVNDVIYEATDEVNLYAEEHYQPSALANNLWVRRCASYLGVYHASRRRADPGKYAKKYEYYIDLLQKILDGKMEIPRLPKRYDDTPALSNFKITDIVPVGKIRVQPEISSGGIGSRQHLMPDNPSGLGY